MYAIYANVYSIKFKMKTSKNVTNKTISKWKEKRQIITRTEFESEA